MINETRVKNLISSVPLIRLRSLWPKRLDIQFIFLFSFLLAGSMFIFSFQMLDRFVKNVSETKIMQASALAKNISATGADFLLAHDYTSIEQLLIRSIDFPGVQSLQVYDAKGKFISGVSRETNKLLSIQFTGKALMVPTSEITPIQLSKTSYVVLEPIKLGDILGWTKVTFDQLEIADSMRQFWNINILMGLFIIALALIILWLLMLPILTSIARYTDFAIKLINKNSNLVLVDTNSIQMKQLGESLNNASKNLMEQDIILSSAMSELERLAAFPEGSQDIVMSLDDQAHVSYINPKGRNTLSELELESDEFEVILPQDYKAMIQTCLASGKRILDAEVKIANRNLLWTFSPLKNQAIVHCYGLEITKRRKAEEDSKRVFLEKQTAELANQTKSAFLANMSHEIRTPLNGVLGFLNLLSKTALTSTQREYLSTTESSAKMLLTVINDILDFSKIEAGKVFIEQVEIEFRELLEEIVLLHAANAEKKRIGLVVVFNKTLPTRLLGDPTRISQVLSNLVGNAIKFTEKGEVLIEAILKLETDKDVLVEISVNDSGIGMSEAALKRMFQPFSQADVSTTRKYGGTGLGLVIAKDLVELMGGEIVVQSQEGQGTRFVFTLRLAKQDNARDIYPVAENGPIHPILTVTSNAGMARSLSESLSAWGVDSELAADGKAALKVLESCTGNQLAYSAIILDQSVGDMTSQAFSDQVKAIKQLGDMPIILMTGLSSRLSETEMKMEGFSGCISKPAKSSELYNELVNIHLFPERISNIKKNKSFRLQSPETGEALRVLIVDDNEINRKLAKILVENMGGISEAAENGALAVKACSQQTYDLILMDAHMPVMDGIEATRNIRKAEQNNSRHTLIIALTADALSGDRKRYLDAGMDEYLCKPINEKAFISTLEKLGLTNEVLSQDKQVVADQKDMPEIDANAREEQAPLAILDPKVGVELSFGDHEIWRTVLGMLFNSLPDYTTQLVAAEDKLEELRQISHKLAGASSYCGTPAVQRAANQLELLVKSGNIELIREAKDALLQQIDRLLAIKIDGQIPGGEEVVY